MFLYTVQPILLCKTNAFKVSKSAGSQCLTLRFLGNLQKYLPWTNSTPEQYVLDYGDICPASNNNNHSTLEGTLKVGTSGGKYRECLTKQPHDAPTGTSCTPITNPNSDGPGYWFIRRDYSNQPLFSCNAISILSEQYAASFWRSIIM